MPPRWPSRHMFSEGIYRDPRGTEVLMLTDRRPYRFREFEDTIIHVVEGNESIWQIAGRYYKDTFERPAGLWWVIADFQPEPIFDPTIALKQGGVIFVPSVRVVEEFILSEYRRDEAD